MSKFPAFVDIHCHILPGIDDGASDWDESLAMARMALEDGFTTIIATPHQAGSHSHLAGKTIRDLTTQLQARLRDAGLPLDVWPGGEARIELDLNERLAEGHLLTLADRGRHMLCEMPHEFYLPLDKLTRDLAAMNITPIVAHPERNGGILTRRELAKVLVDGGCLLQITAESLLGAFGDEALELAEWLVRRRLIHFVSSDAHGVDRRLPVLREAFKRVVELADREFAVAVCSTNPAAVARGENIRAGERSLVETAAALR